MKFVSICAISTALPASAMGAAAKPPATRIECSQRGQGAVETLDRCFVGEVDAWLDQDLRIGRGVPVLCAGTWQVAPCSTSAATIAEPSAPVPPVTTT